MNNLIFKSIELLPLYLYNIDINNWITGNYNPEIIEHLQDDILNSL